jgi:F420-dependent oxidoreductase-like protein
MELAIMIEGQNGIDWPTWRHVAEAVEGLGFGGLYRSDHYTNPVPPEKDSLELWVSLAWLADHTRRVRFGPIVSPITFRHPALSARMALQVDELSGGRLSLGLGAGWQEREHHMFGLDLLSPKERFDRFEEAVEVAAALARSDRPVTFEGRWYQLREAVLLPRPKRNLPILIGGNGKKRTLPLAARFADEWNGVMVPPDEFRALNARLDALLDERGRGRGAVRRSLMHGITFGADRAGLDAALDWRARNWASRASADEMRARGEIVGAGDEVVGQIAAYEEAGVECLMLQWLPAGDLGLLERLASVVSRWLAR